MVRDNGSTITEVNGEKHLNLNIKTEDRHSVTYITTDYHPRNMLRHADFNLPSTFTEDDYLEIIDQRLTTYAGKKCLFIERNDSYLFYTGRTTFKKFATNLPTKKEIENKDTVTCTIRCDVYTSNDLGVSGNYVDIGFIDFAHPLGDVPFLSIEPSNLGWKTISHTFRYSADYLSDLLQEDFYIDSTLNSTAFVYITNIAFYINDTNTTFKLAPEDDLFPILKNGTLNERYDVTSRQLRARVRNKSVAPSLVFSTLKIYNQDTFDFQDVERNFDGRNTNYLFSTTFQSADKISSYINSLRIEDLKTNTNATKNVRANANDLFFLCIGEANVSTYDPETQQPSAITGYDPYYETQIDYDDITNEIAFSAGTYVFGVNAPCQYTSKYTVIPFFDKDIFRNIAINSAVECVNKRKHERDTILYDMLKIRAINDALSSGHIGNAIDFWNAFILNRDIEYDECLKEETRYEQDKCNCSYIVNYD